MDRFTLSDIESENEKVKLTFEWIQLDAKWQEKLLSESFYQKDSIPDGNCQFRSIETALSNAGYRANHAKIRKIIAKYIREMSNEDFSKIIQHYRLEKQMGEFQGEWDPFKVRTKRDFMKHVSTAGFHFEGDNMTLNLLSRASKIDFIIFDEDYNITNLSNPDLLNEKIVVLYYVNKSHYRTIGIKTKRGKMQTLFKRDALPSELVLVLDKERLFIGHTRKVIQSLKEQDKKMTLNGIMKGVCAAFNDNMCQADKIQVMKIIHDLK